MQQETTRATIEAAVAVEVSAARASWENEIRRLQLLHDAAIVDMASEVARGRLQNAEAVMFQRYFNPICLTLIRRLSG